MLVEILDDLDLGEYEVKLNHRRLLDAMLDIAGVPPQKFRWVLRWAALRCAGRGEANILPHASGVDLGGSPQLSSRAWVKPL